MAVTCGCDVTIGYILILLLYIYIQYLYTPSINDAKSVMKLVGFSYIGHVPCLSPHLSPGWLQFTAWLCIAQGFLQSLHGNIGTASVA